MIAVFKKQNGMTIIGQGGRIALFTLPSLIAAVLLHTYSPQVVALPESIGFIRPVGYILLLLGLLLWGTARFGSEPCWWVGGVRGMGSATT